jgi:hypothetical protein
MKRSNSFLSEVRTTPDLASTVPLLLGDRLPQKSRRFSPRLTFWRNIKSRDFVYGVLGIVVLSALLVYLSILFASQIGVLGGIVVGLLLQIGVLGGIVVGLLLLGVVVAILCLLLGIAIEMYFDAGEESTVDRYPDIMVEDLRDAPDTLAGVEAGDVCIFPKAPDERRPSLRLRQERARERDGKTR